MSPPSANVAEAIISGGRAGAPAVLYRDELLTYGELRARVYGWAARLLDQGLVAGDRVGLFAENSPFFIAAYLGIIRAGLCVVPFQVDAGDKTLQRVVSSTGMKRILVSARFRSRWQPLAEKLNVPLEVEPVDPIPQADRPPALPELDPRRDLASLMLTSGSTGEPKAVMVTHRNIDCNTRDILQYTGIAADDRTMVVLPFYHCYGASLMHTHLMAGGSLVLNNRFMFPEKVLDEIQERECTGLAGVPATYQILLRKTRLAQRNFPSLRWLQQAGGRLPNPFIRELRHARPDVRVFVMYGQTEATARLSYLPPERLDDKVGSIGKGLPGTRLEVLCPDGTPVRPGSDEVGEIVASGENVTLGYWNDPEETRRFFRDGKLYTGDMARVDADGFIFLVERARDFIKPMGNRVSPKEVEEVIAGLPEVVEVAVVGTPDEILGEAIAAFVVTARPGELTADRLRDHCRDQLPNYKIPQHVEFLRVLPKTANGKVAKEELKKLCPPGPTSASAAWTCGRR
jgi:acyl-CoA synthetase (AMP-forming)/AMP-acid ligase II